MFAAFLDQGRWLLREQQERGRSFQANAVALLGFDGVVLGILASGDFLASADDWSVQTIAGIGAVAMLAVSAFAAVLVITPRGTGAVVIDDTLDAWQDIHAGVEVRANQHFAHMLLAKDPAPATPPESRTQWWRRRAGRLQVLHQAADLAKVRSRWTRVSAVSLLGAVAALVVVILASLTGVDDGVTSPSPTPTTLATHR